MMDTKSTRNWFRIALIALVPSLAVGIAALVFMASGDDRVEAVDESTTTATLVEITTTSSVDDGTTTTIGNDEVPGEDADDQQETESDGDQPEQANDDPKEEDEVEEEEDQPGLVFVGANVPDEIFVENGEALLTIENIGEVTLLIQDVSTNGHPIEFDPDPIQFLPEIFRAIDPGESLDFTVKVDTSDLPVGPYEMLIDFELNMGSYTVEVKGTKNAVLAIPDLDITGHLTVPHNIGLAFLKIVNNADHDVEITLSSDDARLSFPTEFTLTPGENYIELMIDPVPVQPTVQDDLELVVSWSNIELGTVKITKFGI